ncbi:LIV-I protein F [Serratia fonticola]|uniref:LIV-I protein F n=1 Tax=Serratia fonticola TaxID=47917 RepID=A0A4U9TR05_SERFO|nr:LIV-I protein F [Serratia fonticola]
MSEVMLEFREVDVHYGPIQALQQVSLQVRQGETVALIGANGAGKSTLLMSIFGQPRISGGQILFQGTDISQRSTHFVASSGIARPRKGGGSSLT